MSQKDLKQQIEETRTYYDSIGRVYSKILNSYVYFTAEGKRHLIYKGNRKKRPVNEQWYKLNLFPLVIPVLKHSTSISDWRFPDGQQDEDVQYYAVVCSVGKHNIPVRVIVMRTGDGQINYHSVMKHDNNHRTKKPRK
jgi:hypothetical protein